MPLAKKETFCAYLPFIITFVKVYMHSFICSNFCNFVPFCNVIINCENILYNLWLVQTKNILMLRVECDMLLVIKEKLNNLIRTYSNYNNTHILEILDFFEIRLCI